MRAKVDTMVTVELTLDEAQKLCSLVRSVVGSDALYPRNEVRLAVLLEKVLDQLNLDAIEEGET